MKKVKGKYGAILLAVLMMISFVAGNAYAATVSKATDFKDVAKDAWYYDYVACLADRDVVQGYGDTGEYQPMNLATREHAAKMIALAAGLDYSGKKADFPDVDPLGEFSPYIAALVEKGAIQGFPDGSFRPQDTIKRSHAAKMIQLAFGLKLSTKEINIIDLPTHDPELVGAIEVLASNGVVKGYGDSNRFKPDHDVNRAEFAKMLCIAITATAIQEAETLRTPAAISRAQALVDGMSNDQDTNTRSFLQTRLDTLKKPVDPDPGKPDVPGPVEVKGITIDEKALNPDPLPMTRLSLQLHATITPSNATNQNITWSSSDVNLATVDEHTGLVEAVSKGPVTITATTEDGKKSDSIDINVPIVVYDAKTLTEAVDTIAVSGDIILLKPGLYQLTKTLEITKSVSLIGPQADVDPRPSISPKRTYEEGEEVSFEAILTGDGKSTVEKDGDPKTKKEASDREWLASLFMIKADNVTINGLTMQRTHNHIIDASEKVNTGLKVVYNIVRQGRGNEGIKLAKSINALAERNYIYDIRLDGDAIEAVGAQGFQILENEIDGCDSVNGTINISNKAGGELGVVEGNLIKNTSYQFAITCKDGSGNVLIKDNVIEKASTGGIFIYKYTSPSSDDGRTEIKITGNKISEYATSPPSGTDSVATYLRETASAIAVSFNLKAGYQPEITIQGNTTTFGGTDKPVLAFGGGTPDNAAIATDLSLITVKGNTFDKKTNAIKYFKDKTSGSLDPDGNSWSD